MLRTLSIFLTGSHFADSRPGAWFNNWTPCDRAPYVLCCIRTGWVFYFSCQFQTICIDISYTPFLPIIIDEEPPRVQCPEDQTRNAADGTTMATVHWDEPLSVRDNVDFSTLTAVTADGVASGDLFQLGSTEVTYSAADGAGNVGMCSFTVFVSGRLVW